MSKARRDRAQDAEWHTPAGVPRDNTEPIKVQGERGAKCSALASRASGQTRHTVWKDLAAQTANPNNLDNRIPRKSNESQRLLYALLKYGVANDFLVSPGFSIPFADAKRLRLSLRGLWLRWWVEWATKGE